MLTSSDLVVLTNNGVEPLTFRWDGKTYGAPPGASVHLPFDVVRKEFGDPRSGAADRVVFSEDGRERIMVPSRDKEVARLSHLYGVGVRAQIEGRPMTLADVVPDVSVTTVDGTAVPTVAADPTGDVPLTLSINLDSPEAVAAQVAQMQKDLDAQRARLTALIDQAEGGSGEPGDDTKVDGPGNRPKGGQAGAAGAAAGASSRGS